MITPLMNSEAPWGSKKHFPVCAPALFCRQDVECVEPLRQSADGLVCSEDPLSCGNQRPRDDFQILAGRANAFSVRSFYFSHDPIALKVVGIRRALRSAMHFIRREGYVRHSRWARRLLLLYAPNVTSPEEQCDRLNCVFRTACFM